MKVNVRNRQKALSISASSVKATVRATCRFLRTPQSEVSVYFVTTKEIQKLHALHFQDPSSTDCISFPLEDPIHLGEIVVCPETALLYAIPREIDPYKEVLLYIVHGLLHLLGWDDLEPKKRRAMRKKEKHCMDHLRTKGLSITP